MVKLNAGIIIIGNEILIGRTKDTNSNFIAKKLIKAGIELEQIRVIPDEQKIIIDTVLEFHKLYKYVFTTGGIGPTHDDITSESLSKAFKKKYCYHPEAYKILEKYYTKKEFNKGRKRMAKMPDKVELIFNPLTVAPGYRLKNIYVLPGVPIIMKKMFNQLIKNLKKGKPKKILTINIDLYESIIAAKLSKIQKQNPKCSIGSYPYFNHSKKLGGVNVVISSWELENLDNIKDQIKKMIKSLGGKSFLVYK